MTGGGAVTKIVCGFFGCERHAAKLFLAGLPPLMKVSLRGDAAGSWIETSILHLCREAAARRPGGTVLLSRMAEALFIESLRRYMEQLPPEQTGWLAGACDPVVGVALALLHRRPSQRWEPNGADTALRLSRRRHGARRIRSGCIPYKRDADFSAVRRIVSSEARKVLNFRPEEMIPQFEI